MRKLLLTIGILSFIFFYSHAVEKAPEFTTNSKANISLNQQVKSSDLQNPDLSTKNEVKTSEVKSFFSKIKNKLIDLKIKKRPFKGKKFYIGSYLLGFFFGPIGILIVFLANLKQPDRKAKVLAAVVGWALWLSILGIILTATL